MDIKTLQKLAGITEFKGYKPYEGSNISITGMEKQQLEKKHKIKPSYPFTRSRDALKSIRPEGWGWWQQVRRCVNKHDSVYASTGIHNTHRYRASADSYRSQLLE
jgi:hypothetical protein